MSTEGMVGLLRPQFLLFGDSITEQSFRPGGWGAALADTYSRKDRLRFEIETDQETGPRDSSIDLSDVIGLDLYRIEKMQSQNTVSDDPGLKLINEELRLQPHQDVGSVLMGTECIQAQRNRSHILRMLPDDSEVSSCSSNSGKIRKDVSCSIMDNDKSIKSLRHRPQENNSQFDNNSEEEDSDCMHFEEVEARWIPEGACRHTLVEALVFYPTEKEFEDPLNYINNIRPRAEPLGIWGIIPPSSWKPPCFLKEKRLWQNLKFSTRVQQINKLQNREILKGTSTRRRKRQKVLKIGGNSDEINLGLKLVRISHRNF